MSHLTSVLAFKDYTAIGAETKYTQEIAINLLNKYIFPSTAYEGEINNVQNPSRVVEDASRIAQIKGVKRGLISWLFSHEDDAEQYIPNFNEQEFDNINRDAFNSILDMNMQDFLRGVEGTTVEALTQSIDNLDVAAVGADKFKAIADAVKDGKFFNTNITLRDIKNKTAVSEQFYKLTPTTVDDPLFQQYLQMTEDTQYATASSAKEGTKKGYLNINKMLEVAKRWAHVISSREFTKILNGVESNTTDEELEEYRRQGVDIKWEGLNSPEDIIALMKKGEDTPWQIILANFLARSIVDKSRPDHISYNYELFYPLSVFDEFSKMDELLDEIKSESLDKLKKFMVKNTYDFSFDVEDFEKDLTFNNNFSDGDDLNKFLNVCHVIELVNEHDNKKLKGLDAVNKLASEIAEEVLEQLSGGKIIVTQSTTKQVDVELDGKNLPLRILEGTNPISINDMEDLLGETEYTKDTINMLDGKQDDASIIEIFDKITSKKKTDKGIAFSKAIVYTSTSEKDTVELSLNINLDLSKKSPIPDAAKSMTKTRKPNIQKFNNELNLQKYAEVNTDNTEPAKLSVDEQLLNIAEKALDTLQDFGKTHRMLSIIKGNDVQKILRQTQIKSVISILNSVINSASDEVKGQYSERLSNITNVIVKDDLQYDELMTVIEPMYTLITDITQQLEPSDDELMPETSDMSDEEYEEWAERKKKDLQELEDEESDEEEGVVQDDTLSPEVFLELEGEIKDPDDIGTIAHLRKITQSDNVDDVYREKLDFLNEFGRSEDNINAIKSLTDEKEKLKGDDEKKVQLLNVNAEYNLRTILQQLMQVDEEASVPFINSLITKAKKSISSFKKTKGIESTMGSSYKLLKGYNIKQMVIDILTRSSGFNTVDIADLSGTIKLTFIFNKSYGSQQRFGNKLKSFTKLQYSQKKRVESTSGKVDFTVVPLHGKNYTMRSVLTQQDTARVSVGDKRKGEIYDFFKVRIYNELYSNINELDRLLKRVEAE